MNEGCEDIRFIKWDTACNEMRTQLMPYKPVEVSDLMIEEYLLEEVSKIEMEVMVEKSDQIGMMRWSIEW